MSKRRPLISGLTPTTPTPEEEAFVYGSQAPEVPPLVDKPAEVRPALNRVPLTTRVRGDIGAALKRAHLERQLHGQEPDTIQDILEAALEPWLKEHGYLP